MNEYINSKPPVYDPAEVQPMRDELTFTGFTEAYSPKIVEDILSKKDDKTTFLFINSVCGCAAGSARPGAILALQNNVIPDNLITVFAGQDRDAVDFLREKYLTNYATSSPFAALFKNGEPLYVIERHEFLGQSPEQIAEILISVFKKFCNRQGPSISKENYDKMMFLKQCSSGISLN